MSEQLLLAMRAEIDRLRASLTATQEQSDKWRILFGDVARALKCLPSCFVSQNDHVYHKAERIQHELDQAIARAEVAERMAASMRAALEVFDSARFEGYFEIGCPPAIQEDILERRILIGLQLMDAALRAKAGDGEVGK